MKHERNTVPKIEEFGTLSEGRSVGKTARPRLMPLVAPSHEDAAAVAVALRADSHDETAVEDARAGTSSGAHTVQSLVRNMHSRTRTRTQR